MTSVSRRSVCETAELSVMAFDALLLIDKYEALGHTPTASQIQRELGILPAQMTRINRQLDAQECIRRDINPLDRRTIHLSLTQKGKAAIATGRLCTLRRRMCTLRILLAAMEKRLGDAEFEELRLLIAASHKLLENHENS